MTYILWVSHILYISHILTFSPLHVHVLYGTLHIDGLPLLLILSCLELWSWRCVSSPLLVATLTTVHLLARRQVDITTFWCVLHSNTVIFKYVHKYRMVVYVLQCLFYISLVYISIFSTFLSNRKPRTIIQVSKRHQSSFSCLCQNAASTRGLYEKKVEEAMENAPQQPSSDKTYYREEGRNVFRCQK